MEFPFMVLTAIVTVLAVKLWSHLWTETDWDVRLRKLLSMLSGAAFGSWLALFMEAADQVLSLLKFFNP